MVEGVVTWPFVGLLLAGISGALGLWWRLESRFKSLADHTSVVSFDLQAYKLTVAKEYSSNQYVADVENKMTKRLDDVLHEIRELRSDLHQSGGKP